MINYPAYSVLYASITLKSKTTVYKLQITNDEKIYLGNSRFPFKDIIVASHSKQSNSLEVKELNFISDVN